MVTCPSPLSLADMQLLDIDGPLQLTDQTGTSVLIVRCYNDDDTVLPRFHKCLHFSLCSPHIFPSRSFYNGSEAISSSSRAFLSSYTSNHILGAWSSLFFFHDNLASTSKLGAKTLNVKG